MFNQKARFWDGLFWWTSVYFSLLVQQYRARRWRKCSLLSNLDEYVSHISERHNCPRQERIASAEHEMWAKQILTKVRYLLFWNDVGVVTRMAMNLGILHQLLRTISYEYPFLVLICIYFCMETTCSALVLFIFLYQLSFGWKLYWGAVKYIFHIYCLFAEVQRKLKMINRWRIVLLSTRATVLTARLETTTMSETLSFVLSYL